MADQPAAINIPQWKIDANPESFEWYTDEQTGGGALWTIGSTHAGKRINQLPESYLFWARTNLGGTEMIQEYHNHLTEHAESSPQDFLLPFKKFKGERLTQCPPGYLRSLHHFRDTNAAAEEHPALYRAIRQLVDPPPVQRQPRPVSTQESSTTSRQSGSTRPSAAPPDQPRAGPSSQSSRQYFTNGSKHWPIEPIIITDDVVDDNPDYYRWYADEKQGEFVLPFGPYKNRTVNSVPESYIMELLDDSGELDAELHNALVQYITGLQQHATDGYAEFLVPFGQCYGRRKLSCVRDKPWLEHTKTLGLQSRYPAFFLAVEQHLQFPNHQGVKRDIGELLRRSKWKDDLELRIDRAEEERYVVHEDEYNQEEEDEVDNEGEEKGDSQLSYFAALGQGFRLGRPSYAPSPPQLEREEEDRGCDDTGDEENESEDYEASQASVRSCSSSPAPQRPPSQAEALPKLSRRSSYEDSIALQLFGSDEGVVSSAAMSVDDVVKSEKDIKDSDSPSASLASPFQTPTRPRPQRQSTPGPSSRVARRVVNSHDSPNRSSTTPERKHETIDISDSSEPRTPIRPRPRRYDDRSVISDDEDDVQVKSVSRKRRRDAEEAEVETPTKRNKGKGKMKDISKLLWT